MTQHENRPEVTYPQFEVGEKVNHRLYGKGEVIKIELPQGNILVHYFKCSLDQPNGFNKITARNDLEKI